MTNSTGIQAELDHRESNGIAVTLLWHRATNAITVRVHDSKSGEEFDVHVSDDEALQAFRHPYAYAATRPVRYRHLGDLSAV